jgi:predicted CopG family antitoxin
MVSVTLSVPEEMKSEMDEHPEINWSEVARQSIERKLAELRFLETFKAESELTEAEAIELGRGLKAQMRERYEE